MPERFAAITGIRTAPGLRTACLRGVPTPWAEAAKGIFHIKGLDWQHGVQGDADGDINAALTPRLRAPQRRIHDHHLEWPVPLG